MVQRGDINGASFGFYIDEGGDSWEMGDDDMPIRTVTAIRSVPEVSVGVVFPAYPQSSTVVQRCNEFRADRDRHAVSIATATRRRKLRLIELGA
jgi:phage head maturation protease